MEKYEVSRPAGIALYKCVPMDPGHQPLFYQLQLRKKNDGKMMMNNG